MFSFFNISIYNFMPRYKLFEILRIIICRRKIVGLLIAK